MESIQTKKPSLPRRITVLAGGVIGALTFAATDSFWFNAVEAEVYALSMFFTAAVVWLIMKWSEQARTRGRNKLAGKQHPFGLSANRYLDFDRLPFWPCDRGSPVESACHLLYRPDFLLHRIS